MKKLEREVKADIRVELTKDPSVRLFNNPVGTGWQGKVIRGDNFIQIFHPRAVTFGLCDGSSDLVGWQSFVITPEMVGKRIAQFVAIETKRESGGRFEGGQLNFVRAVREAGGAAGVARSVSEANDILGVGFPRGSR